MEHQQNIEQYIEMHSSPELPILTKIYRETNVRFLNPRMVSGHIQGMLIAMLSKMISPELILEIGTFTGYSAICLVQGLKPEGKLHTIEINDEISPVAHGYFVEAGLEKKIIEHIGDARKIIPLLNLNFDLIFIDGEKNEYLEYYKICVDCLNPGGYLLADNVLWNEKIVDQNFKDDPTTQAIITFNKFVQDDRRIENIILPLRDGLTVARKKL
jgi:predicted O-methyltransferase YrrM